MDRVLSALLGCGLAAVLVCAPWFFGGVAPAGRLFLEVAALLLLPVWIALAWRRPEAIPGSATILALCGLLALSVLQLAPLPASWVATLSPLSATQWTVEGSEAATAAETRLLGLPPGTLDAPARATVDPPATASALRTGVALALLLAAAWTHAALRGARTVVAALLVSGAFQALYGLLVLVSGADRIWHAPKEYFLDSATGTFVNANHFAVWLAMAGCGGAGLLARWARVEEDGRRHWLVRLFGARGARGLLTAFALAAIGAGIVASFSRAGIALALLGGIGVILLAPPRRHAWRGAIALALLAAAAAVPLAQLGADNLLAQYAQLPDDAIEEGGRLRVWKDTVDLFARAPAVGTGFGTFASAYPLVRSAEVRKYYAHAHNDPLQLAAEAGIPGLLCAALLLAALAPALLSALAGERGPVAVGLACALAVVALHGLIDFDLHIPATAAAAAIVAGTLGGAPVPADLRIVEPDPQAPRLPVRRLPAFARACALAALALLAYLVAGAAAPGDARHPPDAAEDTRALLNEILEQGANRPEVADELRNLRAALGRRPLDARTRSLYAVALLGAARDVDDLAAADAHARRALATAPVTVSVVRRAVQVLARTGETDEVVRRVRTMFDYDPAAAARTLADLRPWLGEPSLDAVPDRPAAWAALARELRARRFDEQADAWILDGHAAWPRDPALLRLRATVAMRDRDWTGLDALFPDSLELEPTAENAALFAYRAIGRARTGAPDAAREAAGRALALGSDQVSVLLLAGEALQRVGDVERARRAWSRGLFLARGRDGAEGLRRALLERLARAEDASGRPSRAIALWRDVLELDPDHTEARARVRALAGPP